MNSIGLGLQQMQKILHYPVMLSTISQHISTRMSLYNIPNPHIADCTFGLGGHSMHFLRAYPNCTITGYQIDPAVIAHFHTHYQAQLTATQLKRLTLLNDSFTKISTHPKHSFNFIIADLGFNSLHIETNRGFTWLRDEPLNMLYADGVKAMQIVNKSSVLELKDILDRFGQLEGAFRIAKAIVEKRPINTTFELRDAVVGCFQDNKQRGITKVFQAVRMCVNEQMHRLRELCCAVEQVLKPQGEVLFITFHSIERNVIHQHFKKNKIFSKIKIQTPKQSEIEENKKSHSAKLLSIIKNK